jgi:hypothetical protein
MVTTERKRINGVSNSECILRKRFVRFLPQLQVSHLLSLNFDETVQIHDIYARKKKTKIIL